MNGSVQLFSFSGATVEEEMRYLIDKLTATLNTLRIANSAFLMKWMYLFNCSHSLVQLLKMTDTFPKENNGQSTLSCVILTIFLVIGQILDLIQNLLCVLMSNNPLLMTLQWLTSQPYNGWYPWQRIRELEKHFVFFK